MRILFFVALGWLRSKLWQRLQAWRDHRKLVGQLKELGVYGGTVDTGKVRKKPAEPKEISTEPDGPVPFGYKTCWTAVRCEDPERVIAALKPRSRQAANWSTGLAAAYAEPSVVFVSPCLDGFVLVIGAYVPSETWEDLHTQVQMFCNYRVSDSYGWMKQMNGETVRKYAYEAEEEDTVFADIGPLTPEELALGFDRFPKAGQADDGENDPGEEDVLDIAAAWGVDPRFEKTTYPPSTGWLCTV